MSEVSQTSRWPPFFLMGIAHHGWNLLPSHFRSENVMFFRDYDVITREFPPKLGNPPISFRNVCSDTLIGTNDTCFFKNSIETCPHPSSPPPFPPPSLPHPTPPSLPTAICVPQSLVKSFRYPPCPPTPTPYPLVLPLHKDTNNFCID